LISDRKSGSVHYGVIEGYSNRTLEKTNPALPSNWKVNILVADSVRRMTLPMSQVNQNYEIGFYVSPTETTWQGKNIYELFDERQSLSREVRQIFSGNVLRAFEKFSGRLVNYSDSDGNLQQGMLMGHDFDLAKRLEQEPVVFPTAAKAKAYLDEIGGALTTGDTDLTIHAPNRSQEAYVLSAYPGKQGAKYHSDEGLLSAIDSEFVSVGGWMKAAVAPERMLQTLDYLLENSGIVADQSKERARQFLGIQIPTTREILNAASAEVFQGDEPPLEPETRIEPTDLMEPDPESEVEQPESSVPVEHNTATAQAPEKTSVVQFASVQALPPTWEERRRELIEVQLLPEKFVEALHQLGLVKAQGYGDRPYSQLSLWGTTAGEEERECRSFWFQIGREVPKRVLLADSPIEALSLSALDRREKQSGTVYMGSRGEAIPSQMLNAFAQQGGKVYVAYGNTAEGEREAWQLAKVIPQVQRRRPLHQNWSMQLQNRPSQTQVQDWLRIAKALEHSPRYQARIQEVSPQVPDAKAALERDLREFRKLQDSVWHWHAAARDTKANPRYLSGIAEIGIGLNEGEPKPLSQKAKEQMVQVIHYYASLKAQTQGQEAGIDLEAG
ncbi:MAG TPA: hypothetical protein V6D19_10920, partial [Stenomitos sp.]